MFVDLMYALARGRSLSHSKMQRRRPARYHQLSSLVLHERQNTYNDFASIELAHKDRVVTTLQLAHGGRHSYRLHIWYRKLSGVVEQVGRLGCHRAARMYGVRDDVLIHWDGVGEEK